MIVIGAFFFITPTQEVLIIHNSSRNTYITHDKEDPLTDIPNIYDKISQEAKVFESIDKILIAILSDVKEFIDYNYEFPKDYVIHKEYSTTEKALIKEKSKWK